MISIIGVPNIDFIGLRKYAFMLSTVLVLLGIFAFVMITLGKAPLGIDFAGGVMIKGYFAQPVHIDALRGALTSEFPDATVTELTDFSEPNAFIIKSKRPENEATGDLRIKAINALLVKSFPGNTFTTASEHSIGPSVGESLKKSAWLAILLSIGGILVYIWFRFDFRSGVAAAIATFHDVLAVTGIFYLFGLEFDLLIVSALL
ncbi:protein translocase subunit SecF, partial [candidate division GN15 bacterium]